MSVADKMCEEAHSKCVAQGNCFRQYLVRSLLLVVAYGLIISPGMFGNSFLPILFCFDNLYKNQYTLRTNLTLYQKNCHICNVNKLLHVK
jgi:hypothetical protein